MLPPGITNMGSGAPPNGAGFAPPTAQGGFAPPTTTGQFAPPPAAAGAGPSGFGGFTPAPAAAEGQNNPEAHGAPPPPAAAAKKGGRKAPAAATAQQAQPTGPAPSTEQYDFQIDGDFGTLTLYGDARDVIKAAKILRAAG